MRRIPRTSRSIDPSAHSSSVLLPRISSSLPCRSALTSSPLARTTSACFSTTARYNIFPSGTQDKKKHQQFVRRWQKRLLGDSEPIGAHVDPYDATSPVRISPDEQGEEREVIESSPEELEEFYKQAKTGKGLMKVGGKKWIQQREEEALLQRFNKIIAPRQLGYGTVNYDFAPMYKIKGFRDLQAKFHQAVVEVYTLSQAGRELSFPTHIKYNTNWTREVKLATSPAGGVTLTNARPKDIRKFLNLINEASDQTVVEVDELIVDTADGSAAAVVEEVEPIKGEKPSSSKATAGKQAVIETFDFMTNRPVPRAQAEQMASEVEEAVEKAAEQASKKLDIDSAVEAIQNDLSEHRSVVLNAAVDSSEKAIAELRKSVHGEESIEVLQSATEAKYRHIPLNDLAIKFAITKRILQLTGHRISDPIFNSSQTLGDLFTAIVNASRPAPTTLRDTLKQDAQLQYIRDQQNKKHNRTPKKEPVKPLSANPNVRFQGTRISSVQKEKELGRWKVIEYALAERGLPRYPRDAPPKGYVPENFSKY